MSRGVNLLSNHSPIRDPIFIFFVAIHLICLSAIHLLIPSSVFVIPDERGYLEIASSLYSNPPEYFGWGWPWKTPILVVQIIYLPFWFMESLGLAEIVSLRLTSLFYSGAAVILLLSSLNSKYSLDGKPKLFLKLLIFLPSFTVFSLFGLREPFIYFAMACIYYGYVLISRDFKMGGIIVVFGILILTFTKDYLGYLAVLSHVIFSVLQLIKIKKRRNMKLETKKNLSIAIVLTLAGVLFSMAPFSGNALHHVISTVGEDTRRNNLTGNSTNGVEGAWQTQRELEKVIQLEKSGMLTKVIELVLDKDLPKPGELNSSQHSSESSKESSKPGELNSSQHSSDSSDALSSISSTQEINKKIERLSLHPKKITDYYGNARQTLVLLTSPSPLKDNGSSFLNIFSIETVLLIAFYIFWFYLFWRTKGWRDPLVTTALFFSLLFLAGSASLEINVGTWIRHRTVMLLPLVFAALKMIENKESNPIIKKYSKNV